MNTSNNELTALAANSYSYDPNGNMTKKITTANPIVYTWDFENCLSSVSLSNGSGTESFLYDPFGRRIRKIWPNTANNSTMVRTYLYDGANIVAELNASGTVVASYTQGAGIDEPLAMRRGGYISYYHADGLGSITSLTNTNAQPVATYVYDSFGNTTATEGIFNPFRYTGREQDPETGLYYYRARYYDPTIGRFLSEDPIRFWGGIDFYKYANNSPTNATDPSGNWPWYGNYCGPKWTGGRVEEYNAHHDIEYYKPAIDAADEACWGHDMCYTKCREDNKCDAAARKTCMVNCNHVLADQAGKSGVHNWRVAAMVVIMTGNNMPDSILNGMVGPNSSSCACKN